MSNDWMKETSDVYRQLSQIAVPARTEQIAILLGLIPFAVSETFQVVELASGEGYLSQAIAIAFPDATILALDCEASMREATQKRLGTRGQVEFFDIREQDWFDRLEGTDVVISSLCIHHLDAIEKQRLFQATQSYLNERGAILIADLIAPKITQANHIFASTWDIMAESASVEQTQSRNSFNLFQKEHWNLFHYPDPEFDKPSPLFEQLLWLSQAGFPIVDCFWIQAGHAIYGAYKQERESGIDFRRALTIAHKVLWE